MVYVLTNGDVVSDGHRRAKAARSKAARSNQRVHTIHGSSGSSPKSQATSMFWANNIGGFLLRSIVLSVVLSMLMGGCTTCMSPIMLMCFVGMVYFMTNA